MVLYRLVDLKYSIFVFLLKVWCDHHVHPLDLPMVLFNSFPLSLNGIKINKQQDLRFVGEINLLGRLMLLMACVVTYSVLRQLPRSPIRYFCCFSSELPTVILPMCDKHGLIW